MKSIASLARPVQALAEGVAVSALRERAGFSEIAREWNALHERADAASVFNSWIWQYQWWQAYGAAQPLHLLVARDAGGTLVGVLPLYVQAIRAAGVPVRVLRMVGTGADTHPDDLGPVLAPGRELEASAALARAALAVPQFDIALLTDLEPRSGFAHALVGEARIPCTMERSARILYVDLPKDWPGYLESVSAHRRAKIRSGRRKLAAASKTRFFVWDDAAGLDGALEQLAALHRKRWASAGESASFASADYLRFHRAVLKVALRRGWLRLYCLELDGRLVAMLYALRFRDGVYLVQAGFDPDYARLRVGSVLLMHAIEHAIGEGSRVFDFLKGEHSYKEEIATGERETLRVAAYRPSAGAMAYRLRHVLLPALRQRALALWPRKHGGPALL